MITKAFATAGKAIFTVANASGDHYTFRVTRKPASDDYPEAWFVSLLTGSDNTSSYTYLGMLDVASGNVRLTAKSRYADDSVPVRVVRWALGIVWRNGSLPQGYTCQHAGKCGRCGRLLTVPESIETGIGPECARKMSCQRAG